MNRRRHLESKAAPLPRWVGPYRIEAHLGQGGTGTVYRAYDERLRRPVALKRLLAERTERQVLRHRLLREARAAARLNHPSLVQVHDILILEDADWLVMEFVPGETVATMLRHGPLAPAVALSVARDVAAGLVAIHTAGLVHQDLKAENVCVTPNGQAKILDFGFTRPRKSNERTVPAEERRLTGTVRAMSPEQVRGEPVDHRADLFALGVFLYESLTAKSPFLGTSPEETLARACCAEPPPLAIELPSDLATLIDQLLHKDPAARSESAKAVHTALTRCVDARATDETPNAIAEKRSLLGTTQPATAALTSSPEPPLITGERRLLTVMACALVSTEAVLDPEDLAEVLPRFERSATELIEQLHGYLGEALGHRLVIVFGYPHAQEDAPQRAVLTALKLRHHVAKQASGLALRVGIHTGPAFLSLDTEPPEARPAAARVTLSDTLDVALALQHACAPDVMLMDELSHRLSHEHIDAEPISLPGRSDVRLPRQVYRVRISAPLRIHLPPAASGPRFGGTLELDLLADRLEMADEGSGQALLISGEVGVGKSRLLRAFHEGGSGASRWLWCRGVACLRHTPLYVANGVLKSTFGPLASGEIEKSHQRLETQLEALDLPLCMASPLRSLLDHAPFLAPPLTAKLQAEAVEALTAVLVASSEQQPLVVVCEDIQWADVESLAFLGRLLDFVHGSAMLLVLTCRPGFRAPWHQRARLLHIQLPRLDDASAERLLAQLDPQRALSAEVRRSLQDRAEGIPRQVIELTRDRLASNAHRTRSSAVAATLEPALIAQLERVASGRQTARIAAALGREFEGGDLARLSDRPPRVIVADLDHLCDAGLIEALGTDRYRFRRALLREAIWETWPEEDRVRLQRRLHPQQADTLPADQEVKIDNVSQNHRIDTFHGPSRVR